MIGWRDVLGIFLLMGHLLDCSGSDPVQERRPNIGRTPPPEEPVQINGKLLIAALSEVSVEGKGKTGFNVAQYRKRS